MKAALSLAAVFALFVTSAFLWWGPDESGEGLPMYGSPPLPGQTIAGKWKLKSRLPGPGTPLYRAKDLKTGAARLVRGPLAVPVTEMLRAVEAAAAAAKLTHPALADLFETGREVRGVFVAGEDWSGQTLEEALARTPALDAPFARRLAAQTAAALGRLHQDGFVHGGFAPRWVLLREDGTIKLRGFGPVPDPSPEEYREPGGRVPDRASDQYAWAAVLYRALAGAPPFGGADGPELKGESGGCPSPARHRAGLPPALDGFFRLALDPDPARRFDSMEAAAKAFDACWPLPAPQNAKMGA
jgi:serine/threonine-protein kinase